jgi:hypothetical protein
MRRRRKGTLGKITLARFRLIAGQYQAIEPRFTFW